MIEDPFNPTKFEIETWAFSKEDEKWPEQDWDFYVSEGELYQVVFLLASNLKCPKRSFFLHALYVMIGDALHEDNEDRQETLLKWLSLATNDTPKDVRKWKKEAIEVIKGEKIFNVDYWYDIGLDRVSGNKELENDAKNTRLN